MTEKHGTAQRMIRSNKRIYGYVVSGILLSFLAISKGCEHFPASTFNLASESRLPRWLTLPPKHTRADVTITMSYIAKPWGGSARFTLQDAKRTLADVNGGMKCRYFSLESVPEGTAFGYPIYQPITVNYVTEIIEHRKMEPIFYVTDDTAVWNRYREMGCAK